MTFTTLTLLLPVAVMLHVTEEFLYPGGFIEWYQEWVPSKTKGIRPGYLVWINTLMIGVCVVPAALGATEHGVGVWYAVAAIAAANAIFHVVGVFRLKKYSPGVVTGVLFYLPLFVIGSYLLLSSGQLGAVRAVFTVAAAIGYHIFSVIRQGR
ncbi:MAG TPA: HXXEE domain-containing protein [Puia sp.]